MIKKDFKLKLIIKSGQTGFAPAAIGLSVPRLDHIEGVSPDQ